MENPKSQLIARIKESTNVLVTVSTDPTVDQLSAAIGFALLLNKMGKHATAVYSGKTPSTIEFLEPGKTLEKNTDSLRDFIIALDKSKADKLRYKVEDEHVKIFITPYRTSITQEDLEFSQGDLNVDTVVALGVHDARQLDQAITAHGRILHDATVISVTNDEGDVLGSINWSEPRASGLCEMFGEIADQFQENLLDGQMATAFLTGIVAETERFSNQKTSSVTMSVSARLMAAGANQQLVAEQLAPKPAPAPEPVFADIPEAPQAPAAEPAIVEPVPAEPPKADDGALHISHIPEEQPETAHEDEPDEPEFEQIHIDEHGELQPFVPPAPVTPAAVQETPEEPAELPDVPDAEAPAEEPAHADVAPRHERVIEPPADFDASAPRLTLPPLDGDGGLDLPPLPSAPMSEQPVMPTDDAPLASDGPQTLSDIERAVHSSHLDQPAVAQPVAEDEGRHLLPTEAPAAPNPFGLPAENPYDVPADLDTPPPGPPPMMPGLGLPPLPTQQGQQDQASNPFSLPPQQ